MRKQLPFRETVLFRIGPSTSGRRGCPGLPELPFRPDASTPSPTTARSVGRVREKTGAVEKRKMSSELNDRPTSEKRRWDDLWRLLFDRIQVDFRPIRSLRCPPPSSTFHTKVKACFQTCSEKAACEASTTARRFIWRPVSRRGPGSSPG